MHIFMGGYANSGKGVLQIILNQEGYFTGDEYSNIRCNDFLGDQFPKYIYHILFHDCTYLIRKTMRIVGPYNKWSLSHGHFMLIVPIIKHFFPESKFILTIRNPNDTIYLLRKRLHFDWCSQYGGIPRPTIEQTIDFFARCHYIALELADLVIKIEDENRVKKLFDFCNISTPPETYFDLLKPKDVGCGSHLRICHPIMKELGY